MVASKSELFDEELQSSAILFKVLAHPARLQILRYLARSGTCLSGDITGLFPLTRTTLNQHMNELRDAGLICSHEKGSKNVWCLDCGKLQMMRSCLSGLLDEFRLPEDFCCKG